MNFHMPTTRTTLVIDEQCLVELKRVAAADRRTLSAVVDEFLRAGLATRSKSGKKKRTNRLPAFDMGRPMVNLADRGQLIDALEK